MVRPFWMPGGDLRAGQIHERLRHRRQRRAELRAKAAATLGEWGIAGDAPSDAGSVPADKQIEPSA